MTKQKRPGGPALAALAVAWLALSGWTSYDLEALRAAEASGTPFQRALASGYLEFANSEAAQYDWIDSRHFARKGRAAAQGRAVSPENPADWRTPAEALTALSAAGDRLARAIAAGAARRAPRAAAAAQVNFDCWVEQLEENWQHDAGASVTYLGDPRYSTIDACRGGFNTAMARVMAAAGAPALSSRVMSPTLASTDFAAAGDAYLVFFAFDSATFDGAGRDAVAAAVKAAGGIKLRGVVVEGHADRAGAAPHNMLLSLQRAAAARALLTQLGINADLITARGLGETAPRVKTGDGVREPGNRRVEIRLQFDPADAPMAGKVAAVSSTADRR